MLLTIGITLVVFILTQLVPSNAATANLGEQAAGDPAAVAAALDALRAHPRRARAFGRAGRRRAFAEYGWDRVAAAHEQAYAGVLASTTMSSGVLTTGSPA